MDWLRSDKRDFRHTLALGVSLAATSAITAVLIAKLRWLRLAQLEAAATPSSCRFSRGDEQLLAAGGPIAKAIGQKVMKALSPDRLWLHDDSASHRGHRGVADANTPETHFRLEVVAESFKGMARVKRQQKIYDLLQEEFAAGLHALELQCRTPEEEQRALAAKS
mmetsp:Transcript_24890/g.45691  ORF Transcript_24890/g.45691 Transcript_24890/m.45691 type:complete len:165 (+) Transcript_24890:71-565(+)